MTITNSTSGHQSVIFGLRELNSTEMNNSCSNYSTNNPPVTNDPFNFTSDYKLRDLYIWLLLS